MGTRTDFDAMMDAAIEAYRLAMAHGSPEFGQAMRMALFVLGREIAKDAELSEAGSPLTAPKPKQRFFCHLRTERGLERDTKGSELPGLDEAYLKAHRMIPAIAVDMMRAGRAPMPCAFEIADDTGALLMEVPFAEVLEPKRPAPRVHAKALQHRGQSTVERTQRLCAELREQSLKLRETVAVSRELVAPPRVTT